MKNKRIGERAIEAGYVTPEQVEQILAEQQARRERGERHLPFGVLLVEEGALTPSQLMELLEEGTDSSFRFNEDAVRLTMRLLADRSGDDGMSILFTGLSRGDGVTTIVSQVGLVLAMLDQGPVLLVDVIADDRSLYRRFHAPRAPGLIELLSNEATLEEVVFDTGLNGLSVLPPGGNETADEKHILMQKSHGLIAKLKAQYPIVLLDLPPITEEAEATLFARDVDSVVLVAAKGAHRKQQFQEVVEALQGYRAVFEGVVLTTPSQELGRVA